MSQPNNSGSSREPQNSASGVGDLKQAILQKIDFRGFYGKYLKSGDAFTTSGSDGWSNRVKCPVHEDRTDPNFFINVQNGSFKCQACGAGGSAFDFWLIMNGYSVKDKRNFRFALEGLAAEVGIKIDSFRRSGLHPNKKPEPAKDSLPGDATSKTLAGADPAIPRHNKADQIDKTSDPISMEVVKDFQAQLRRDHYIYLNTRRGLKKKTIEAWCLGYAPNATWKNTETGKWERGRYVIPVFNKAGQCRNLRLYSTGGDPAYKMLNYVSGKDTPQERKHGQPPRLLNLHRLATGDFTNVIITEGEWDCILLNQLLEAAGLGTTWIAVTGTHGANTFEAEWLEFLYEKSVYLCFDCDEAGKSAALDHVNKHFLPGISTGKFAGVKLVELPLDGSKESKDISDYFLKCEHTVEQLIKLCLDTPDVIIGGLCNDEGSLKPVEVPDFITAIKDRRYIDQRIRVPISISGTTSKVYHAIRSFAVSRCPLMDKEDGECCSVFNTERTLPYGHPLFIEACMERETNILRSLGRIACQKDEKCTITPITKVVMEEYFAHQVITQWKSEEDDDGRMQNAQELVQISVYVLQPEDNVQIEPQNYMATGFIRTHPKTSIATFFIENMIPMEEDWKKFSVENTENAMMLKTLRDEFTVEEIIADIRNGVTRIYEMDEILLTVLLAYLTPLWIYFNGSLTRGWANIAIIGDTGTGKSATYNKFSSWIELGDLFSAMTGTRTGLLYSLNQKSDEWYVRIGRYVQASCKILAIDETQRISKEDISKMALAMDEGFLKVEQVASGGYHTQTRALFLMNPKNFYGDAATISDFTFGCDSLAMCFIPMFIRRLDLALFTTGQQEYSLYNRKFDKDKAHKIRLTARMMRTLVYWAWTRRADQIQWTPEATTTCLELATQLSQEFAGVDEVPLVNPQDFRLKLARLSTSFAVLSRSFSPDMECLIVKSEHVKLVASFIDRIYSMPSCNLRHRSKKSRAKDSMDDYDKIKKTFESVIVQATASRQGDYFVRMLLFMHTMHGFRKRDLADQLNVHIQWVSKRITILQGYNLLEVARNGGYKVTRKFNLFMQKWLQNQEIEQLFSEVQERAGREALQRADDVMPDEQPGRTSSQQSYNERYNPNYYNNDPFVEAPLTIKPDITEGDIHEIQ